MLVIMLLAMLLILVLDKTIIRGEGVPACVDVRTEEQVNRLWSRYNAVPARDRDDAATDEPDDGVFTGRYSGQRAYRIGTELPDGTVVRQGASNSVQMDHVVARNYARRHGGESWSCSKIRRFVNDQRNLVATLAFQNRLKSDDGPSEYLPDQWRCGFSETWDRIAAVYRIELAPSDREAVNDVLEGCALPSAPVTGSGLAR